MNFEYIEFKNCKIVALYMVYILSRNALYCMNSGKLYILLYIYNNIFDQLC